MTKVQTSSNNIWCKETFSAICTFIAESSFSCFVRYGIIWPLKRCLSLKWEILVWLRQTTWVIKSCFLKVSNHAFTSWLWFNGKSKPNHFCPPRHAHTLAGDQLINYYYFNPPQWSWFLWFDLFAFTQFFKASSHPNVLSLWCEFLWGECGYFFFLFTRLNICLWMKSSQNVNHEVRTPVWLYTTAFKKRITLMNLEHKSPNPDLNLTAVQEYEANSSG